MTANSQMQSLQDFDNLLALSNFRGKNKPGTG